MKNATLVIMAAGIGSRFGSGIKQLEIVGPNGEIIIDYSINDAIAAGFNKVVFVIRKNLETEFKEKIGNRISKKIKTEYAFQELNDIPEKYKELFKERTKPWGTGQAILCCKDIIHEPFLVINADDYYGPTAFKEAYKELTNTHQFAMISFILKNTLSKNGGVTRGICKITNNFLDEIIETKNIQEKNSEIISDNHILNANSPVSMNMWCLYPTFFNILDNKFKEFLEKLDKDDLNTEFLLPNIIDELLKNKEISIKVLYSTDKWFGLTYKEDKDFVSNELKKLYVR